MNIEQRLTEIWASDYMNVLPAQIKERGFCYPINHEQKDILITGFNPSFREDEIVGNTNADYNIAFASEKFDPYVTSMQKMIFDSEKNIDLRAKTAYSDLFYFREKNQEFLKTHILKAPNGAGIRFVADQMNLTQHIIENVIKPKFIIVKNKESWAYWGKLAEEKGWIWMGYKFEFVQNMACGELFKIAGLLDTTERIAPEFTETNLLNTFVLFTEHIRETTPQERRPAARAIKTIYDFLMLRKI
jgi:hypothetical protein